MIAGHATAPWPSTERPIHAINQPAAPAKATTSARTLSQISAAMTVARTSSVRIWSNVIGGKIALCGPFLARPHEIVQRPTCVMSAAMHRLPLSAFIAAALAVAACQQEPAADTNAAQEPVLNLPSVPKPQPPIDRAALLAAVTEAASAMAAGTDMPESVSSLD